MASAWQRSSLILAVAAFSACKSPKTSETEIPEAPPARGAAADSPWDASPFPGPAAADPVLDEVPVATTSATPRIHVVRKGDTLMALARQYYADESKWRRIFEANRGQIPDKDRIKIGQELRIPD